MSDEEEITGSEEEGTDTEQETPAAALATDVPKPAEKPVSELKVVIILKADKAMLGVQSPDCDPVYKTMEGDLSAVLQVVPTLVAEAKLKWTAAPRYPGGYEAGEGFGQHGGRLFHWLYLASRKKTESDMAPGANG